MKTEEDKRREEEAEMDAMPDEMDMDLESVEYDLDEEVAEESDEVVEEATKLQDKVADMGAKEPMKGGADDGPEGKKMPAPSVIADGQVKAPVLKDGGEGNHGESAKDHTPSDNINADHKPVNNPDQIK